MYSCLYYNYYMAFLLVYIIADVSYKFDKCIGKYNYIQDVYTCAVCQICYVLSINIFKVLGIYVPAHTYVLLSVKQEPFCEVLDKKYRNATW